MKSDKSAIRRLSRSWLVEQAVRPSLVCEEPALAIDAESVFANRTTGPRHPVAGDHKTDRVRRVGGAHRAGRARCADARRELAVTDRFPGSHFPQGLPDDLA